MPTLLIIILTALISSASTVVIMSLLIMSGNLSRMEEAAASLDSLTLTDEVGGTYYTPASVIDACVGNPPFLAKAIDALTDEVEAGS